MRYILVFVILGVTMMKSYAFSQGTGTENDPYLISSAEDFAKIVDNSEAYYLLADNIELQPTNCVFKGHFDGGGHTILVDRDYNDILYESGDGTRSHLGLIFSECIGAEVKNLKVIGRFVVGYFRHNSIEQHGSSYSSFYGKTYHAYVCFGKFDLGTLCGYASESSFINCSSDVNIGAYVISNERRGITFDCWGSETYIGGLVGNAVDCSFNLCSISGSIETRLESRNGDAWGKPYLSWDREFVDPQPCGVGGVAGYALNTKFYDCFNVAEINDETNNNKCSAGGICGYSDNSEMTCCYTSGNMSGYSKYLLSGRDGFVTATNCFSALIVDSETEELQLFGCPGAFSNCYSVRHEGFSNEDAASDSSWGEQVNLSNLLMKSWYAMNLPLWDFTEKWYLPTDPAALPAFRIEPVIDCCGDLVYGGICTLTSSNPYKEIVVTSDTPRVTEIEGNKVTLKKAGVVNLDIHQDAVIPYRPIDKKLTLTVAQAPLHIDGGSFTMSYGDEVPDFKPTYTGFLFDDNEEFLTKQPVILCDASTTSDIGDYIILVSGAQDENYAITYRDGNCRIIPRELVATPKNATRKYGEENPQFQINYDGFVNGDNLSLVVTRPTVQTDADIYSEAGLYTTYCNGGEVYKNYTLKYGVGTLSIEKANLQVGVKDVTRATGEINPVFELTFDGFKNRDNKYSLDSWPEAVCMADVNSPAGQYQIELQGGSDHNYNYICSNGILTVTESSGIDAVEIDWADDSVTIYTLTGLKVNEENLSPGIYIVTTKTRVYKVAIK